MRSIIVIAAVAATLAAPLAGCQPYEEPIALPPYGPAVRNNMAAQIVDPTPPEPRVPFTNGQRQRLAVERYRADVVEKPVPAATSTVAAPAAPAAPQLAPPQQ